MIPKANVLKNLVSVFSFLLMVYSCSSLDADIMIQNKRVKTQSNHVSVSDVRKYISKHIPLTKASEVSVEPVLSGADTVMYVVNYGEGWEVLSGDRRASIVLISSDSGSISVSDLFATPGASEFMSRLVASLSSFMHNDEAVVPQSITDSWEIMDPLIPFDPVDPPRPPATDTTLVSIDTVEVSVIKCQDHLLPTKWGQGAPWNQYAPYMDSSLTQHCYTGCVPVAIAQVLYYLNDSIGVPESIYGSATCNAFIPSSYPDWMGIVLSSTDISFSDYSALNWSSMPLSNSNTVGADKVSALMMRLGYLFNANYERTGTGVWNSFLTNNTIPILESEYGLTANYRYLQGDTLSVFYDIAETQLYENEMPMLMGLMREANGITYGHYVVIDGYKRSLNQITFRYLVHTPRSDYYYTESYLSPSAFVAINWGWDGAFDSTAGSTNWFNIFNIWVVGNQNNPLEYTIRDHIFYGFEPVAPAE